MDASTIDYRPSPWPRCRDRERVAEIRVNGKHRVCCETYRNGQDDIVVIWAETLKGRNWRQVGRALPLPGRAFEQIVEGVWKWQDGDAGIATS